jgi:purine-binding chemotaxis protein CheW
MSAELLLFRVGRELFAVELRSIEEAIDLTAVEQIPAIATPVRGVLTLRGSLVPLFSPAAALGVTPGEASTALVVRDAAGRLAIAADDVEDVMTVGDGDLRPLPATDARDGGVVRGVVRRGRDLVAVVNLDALIAACRSAGRPEAA